MRRPQRDWLRTQEPGWQVLAVSNEGLESVQAHVEEQGWEVEVGVVETEPSGGMAAVLTGCAPWVFVASGTIPGRTETPLSGSHFVEDGPEPETMDVRLASGASEPLHFREDPQ